MILMKTIELKESLHHLIDDTNNNDLLSRFYNILEGLKRSAEGNLLKKLSKDQMEELNLSIIESEDESNLIPDSKPTANSQ